MEAQIGMIARMRPVIAMTRGPVARGSLQSFAIRLGGLAISFAQGVLAGRLLGVEGYGIVSMALSLANVLATVALLGWGPLAIKEIARLIAARQPDLAAAFVTAGARAVCAGALVAGGLLSASAFFGFVPDAFRAAIVVAGLTVAPVALLQLLRGVAQGRGRVMAAQLPGEVLRPTLYVAFLAGALALQWKPDPAVLVGALAGASTIAVAAALRPTLRGLSLANAQWVEPTQRRRWQAESAPFFGIMLIGILLAEITTLMLGWFGTPAQTGLFQPLARLVPLMVLPAQAVAVSFAPRIADLWSQGARAQVERLTHTFTLVTSAMTVGAVGVLILAEPFIFRAFGPDFMPGAGLLWILAIAQLVNAASGPVGHLLAMTGHAPVALRGQLLALATNVCVGAALIPSQGAQGAAIAMAVGLVLWNLALLLQVRKLLDFDPSLASALVALWHRR